MAKKIILCADDYGLNPEINQGILQLIANKRLSAVSCMTNFADWQQQAEKLQIYLGQIDVGLHFNLTEGKAMTGLSSLTSSNLAYHSLNKLIPLAFLQRLNKADLIKELHAQLDAFEAVFKQPPDFIDSHQHVHHLPIIREALLTVYQQRLLAKRPYLRSVVLSWKEMLRLKQIKIAIIQLTGAHQFKALLIKNNYPHNIAFAGFYNFDDKANYRSLFQSFINQVEKHGLIMCHPGLQNHQDAIGSARLNEFNYLNSNQFIEDAEKFNFQLYRF